MGIQHYESFTFDEMKKYLLAKTQDLHRGRSKISKFFGQFYFQKMKQEEWKHKEANFIQLIEGIHNDKDLGDFMAQQQ